MSAATKKTATQIVNECWGSDAPAWVKQLAAACDETSQANTATRIKRSASLVNMVLKNTYTGDLADVRQRCETALADCVECPVLGDITGTECLNWQNKPFNGANHVLVRMFRACRNCPKRKG